MIVKDRCGTKHELYLVDMGTMDTVLKIDGVRHSFDGEIAASYRKRDGSWSEKGFRAFAKFALQTLE